MIFRQATPYEIDELLREGFRVWSRNRTFEQYCADNKKEDAYGMRFVAEENGKIVSSLILLNLKELLGKKTIGIGSVLTPAQHAGKGYATALLMHCIKNVICSDALIFLYSDISPQFYERFGFMTLPKEFQKKETSTLMVRCDDASWKSLISGRTEDMPDYF